MTKEQMRKEIAEACGWQHVATNHWGTSMFLKGALIGTDPATERSRTIPDYPNDLNAMHEAEKQLTSWRDRNNYSLWIIQITGHTLQDEPQTSTYFRPITASALQRAEAFLRTIGKWIE